MPALSVLQVVRPATGGMRRHVEQLCGGLRSAGVRVSVASAMPLDVALVPVRRIGIGSRPSLVADARAALAAARLARESDLMHAHGLRAAWVCAWASRWCRIPYVVTAHNLAPPAGPAAARLIAWALRGASAVICVSRSVAGSLSPYGVDAGSAAVVPNGVDVAELADLPARAAARAHLGPLVEDGAAVVAALGRLSPEKGFDVLVDAAAGLAMQDPGLRIVLAGAGPQEARLREQVARLGLVDRFLMPGHVLSVRSVLASADVVAVPSRQEGQGIVALEAMAASKPVVASAVGGLAETVVDRVTGLLVPPADPAELARALRRLLADPSMRAAMGDAGRARVAAHFTLQQMVEGVLAVYGRICAGAGPGSRL